MTLSEDIIGQRGQTLIDLIMLKLRKSIARDRLLTVTGVLCVCVLLEECQCGESDELREDPCIQPQAQIR